jgi:hypothetical protein
MIETVYVTDGSGNYVIDGAGNYVTAGTIDAATRSMTHLVMRRRTTVLSVSRRQMFLSQTSRGTPLD